MSGLIGAVEGGGTKFVCAVGTGPGDKLLARTSFHTGDDPSYLLANVAQWLKQQEQQHGKLNALGVASFGPVDLARGFITSTPKPGWQNADVLGPLRRAFPGIPVGFDTDTNGAALGEHRWGAAVGLDDFVYITIGTGIGAGGMVGGKLIHGLVHPEVGHIYLPTIPGDDFAGACPFHDRCWEGLCSGPAVLKRTGLAAEQLPPDHIAWDYVTRTIGFALANLIFTLSPKRIILGGSLRKGGQLGEAEFFRSVRRHVQAALNGYVVSPALLGDGIDQFIVPPLLGDDAGVCGAIALGQALLEPRL